MTLPSTDLVVRLRSVSANSLICSEAADEVERLRGALRIIAEQTVCPELFPEEKDENMLQLKTAVVTAVCALDPKARRG
jgi:hypothetical protein